MVCSALNLKRMGSLVVTKLGRHSLTQAPGGYLAGLRMRKRDSRRWRVKG